MLALLIPAAKTAVYAAPTDAAVVPESVTESTDAVFGEDTGENAAFLPNLKAETERSQILI